MPFLPRSQGHLNTRMALDLPGQILGSPAECEGGLAQSEHGKRLADEPTEQPPSTAKAAVSMLHSEETATSKKVPSARNRPLLTQASQSTTRLGSR